MIIYLNHAISVAVVSLASTPLALTKNSPPVAYQTHSAHLIIPLSSGNAPPWAFKDLHTEKRMCGHHRSRYALREASALEDICRSRRPEGENTSVEAAKEWGWTVRIRSLVVTRGIINASLSGSTFSPRISSSLQRILVYYFGI